MSVEIREVVLTARVIERAPTTEPKEAAMPPREIIDACLAEVRELLERRAQR